MKGNYYPNLDWVRLALAIQVVFVHAGIAERVFISPVPAFLAVSGFVVYGSIQRWPIATFFMNRALRVLPLLFVSFIVVGLLFGTNAMVRNFVFWLWPFGELPVNPVVWSLIFEEFYYALLALLFSIGIYKYKAFPILATIVCFWLVWRGETLGLHPALFLLGGAFFLGNSFYIYRDKIEKVGPWLSTIFLVCSLGTTCYGRYYDIYRPEYAIVDLFSFAAVLTFSIAGPKLPRLRFDLSYSLYLIHCIVRAVILNYVGYGWMLFISMMAISLPLCVLSWYFIEKPALRLKGRSRAVKIAPAE